MLSKGTKISDYTILFLLEEGLYYEHYKVKNKEGTLFNMKLVNMNLAPPSQVLSYGITKEMEIIKGIHHPNIIQFCDQGVFRKGDMQYGYIVMESFHGLPLSDFIKGKSYFSDKEICVIAQNTLRALNHLHLQGIVHNNLNSKSILIPVGRDKSERLKLIDFRYARTSIDGKEPSSLWDRESFALLAPEQLAGYGCMQSDIYSVGLIMYELFYKRPPWNTHCKDFSSPKTVLELFLERSHPVPFPEYNGGKLDERIQQIIQVALRNDIQCRYETGLDMIHDLDNVLYNQNSLHYFNGEELPDNFEKTKQENTKRGNMSANIHGNGFADVAGLEDVKEMLQRSIIHILKDRRRAEKYRITLPNGILLYGPPGCGKSFIAEKFAEEAGFNYIYIKTSDLASVFLHGTQGIIGEIFEKARQKAPTVICFDEFDAMVPSRDNRYAQYQAGEVNEFLTQLNNCGKDNVFVIASSNKPELIDSAILRRGRIDKMFYIPPPDLNTRQQLFEIYLKNRPCSPNINCEMLAKITEYYVASDIAFIVNEAAIHASEVNDEITQPLLEGIIEANKPSLTKSILEQHESIRRSFEGNRCPYSTIGFHVNNDNKTISHPLFK